MDCELYYGAGSTSTEMQAFIGKIRAPYKLIQAKKDRQQPRPADLLKLNPNG